MAEGRGAMKKVTWGRCYGRGDGGISTEDEWEPFDEEAEGGEWIEVCRRRKSARTEKCWGGREARAGKEERDFMGFEPNDECILKDQKRDWSLRREVLHEIMKKHEILIKENAQIKRENKELRDNFNKMSITLKKLEEKLKDGKYVDQGDSETKIEEWKSDWEQEKKDVKASFKDIVKQQIKESTKDEVVRVIKEKPNLVRDTVDQKKSMIVFGLEESKNPGWNEREKELKEKVKQIVNIVKDGKSSTEGEGEVEEVYRIGKYNEEKVRPVKIKMRSQVAAEEILTKTGKLALSQEYKKVWIKRDMNEEEREKKNELRKIARERNETRSEEERQVFYWRVIDMRLRKWYIRARRTDEGRSEETKKD